MRLRWLVLLAVAVAPWAGFGVVLGAAPQPCVLTGFRLVQEPTPEAPGVALLPGGGQAGCFGGYVFDGVSAAGLGFPRVTTDDYRELAVVLGHWTPLDGVPAVSAPVLLAPAVAAGLRAAGLAPQRFLQWINEYDGAGTASRPAMPPSWPSGLPRGLVRDPAGIAGVSPESTTGPGGERAPAGPRGPATPSSVARASGLTVPCAVVPACRRGIAAQERGLAQPWYRRAAGAVRARRWTIGGALAALGLGAAALRFLLLARRNLAWYGRRTLPH